MVVNFFVIEKRLNGGSIYFQKMADGNIPVYTADINEAKRYDSKIEGVCKRSDLGIVEGTTIEEHQLEFTTVDQYAS